MTVQCSDSCYREKAVYKFKCYYCQSLCGGRRLFHLIKTCVRVISKKKIIQKIIDLRTAEIDQEGKTRFLKHLFRACGIPTVDTPR